ncbi:metallophosphoesterase [Oceanobacillus halophilus]|uniref:Metallophosphoesterase n=1 Tax=Oceanobacillus halophilus TaxID=930130 RepID=A0A495AEK3_9BACI|nr:metallophosphoesterase [Oceanobacillus halophilus]RKQ37335.1 metallophosphoesterase [Oceanobacillus halophilus]
MNRRTFLKRGLGSILAVLGLSGGGYFYARDLEPNMLKIQEETIQSNAIPLQFKDFKIVQFSDTHIGFHYSIEQLDKLIDKINSLHPDMIVFTGDLIDKPNKFNQYSQLQKKLEKLHGKYGKFWIYGNHDHGGYGTELIREVMELSGFTLLQNSHTLIEKGLDRIVISGIDDVMLGKPDIDATLRNVSSDLFTILLAHEPDFADKAMEYPVNLQLSGHSHGGQVRFPFIGHLYTPAYAEKYVQGKYQLKQDSFALYVNSGIGTTRLPYRFLCRPELHVYTLSHRG